MQIRDSINRYSGPALRYAALCCLASAGFAYPTGRWAWHRLPVPCSWLPILRLVYCSRHGHCRAVSNNAVAEAGLGMGASPDGDRVSCPASREAPWPARCTTLHAGRGPSVTDPWNHKPPAAGGGRPGQGRPSSREARRRLARFALLPPGCSGLLRAVPRLCLTVPCPAALCGADGAAEACTVLITNPWGRERPNRPRQLSRCGRAGRD